MTKKIGIIALAIGCVLVGLRFGILGALVGASMGGYFLKKYKIISPNSPLVTETKAVKYTKYVLLGIILVAFLVFGYFVFR